MTPAMCSNSRIGLSGNGVGNVFIYMLKHDEFIPEFSVTHQGNITTHLVDRRDIILSEIPCNSKDAGFAPVDFLGDTHTQLFDNQDFEAVLMIQQPVKVKQPLVDDVFV